MGLTLYFIGAGLTKSLERTRPVPLIGDFVQVLTHYVYDKVVLDTLVGMEVGRVHETACDECLELATALRKRGQVTDEERGRFAALVRGRPSESIEAIFKRVESMSPETPGFEIASGLRPAYFRYAINQVFSTIGWDLKLDLLTRFLARQFEDDHNAHVFVSFNYDLALDRAVEIASGGTWQPRDGYGFEFPFYHDGATERCTAELAPGSPRIRILKPHGSLNWLRRRPNGVMLADGGIDAPHMVIPLKMIPPNNWELRYWPSPDQFREEIVIAPPSPTKPSIIPRLRDAEIDAVTKADEVLVIGYSMPTTDEDQWNLIKDAVTARSAAIPKLTIINCNSRPEYFQRIWSLFRPQCVCTFNHGFAEFSARG